MPSVRNRQTGCRARPAQVSAGSHCGLGVFVASRPSVDPGQRPCSVASGLARPQELVTRDPEAAGISGNTRSGVTGAGR